MARQARWRIYQRRQTLWTKHLRRRKIRGKRRRRKCTRLSRLCTRPPQKSSNETGSLVTGIVGVCFAGLGAGWSFIGGSCCGWAGWPLAFIGLILAIISLALKRSTLGWVALGLAIFAFVWVFVSGFILAAGIAGAAGSGAAGAGAGGSSVSRPYTPPRSGTSGGSMTTPETGK